MRFTRAFMAGSAIAAAMLASSQASALNIVLHDIGGVTGSQAEQGFAIAASYWESVITSDVTITFDVGFSALGAGILGGTETNLIQDVPISSYYTALATHAQSTLDAAAVASLRPLSPTGSVNVIVPQYRNIPNKTGVATSGTRVAPDGKPISNTIALATSEARALGYDVSGSTLSSGSSSDADIQFSSTFAFDFNPSDGITAGQYDFIGVAIHEMGHALGFISGVDDFDYFAGPRSNGADIDGSWWGYGLDLFRYSANGQLNWNFNTRSYFSIDGGASAFLGDSYFATGAYRGDGDQASHWKAPGGCTDFVGIMNPYICNGQTDSVTAEDLGALDAIGWNLNVDPLLNPNYSYSTAQVYNAYQGAVPEPATWAMMIGGFGLIGGSLRSRRRAALLSAA